LRDGQLLRVDIERPAARARHGIGLDGEPQRGEASAIQVAPDEADQLHSRAASIVAVPLPPEGPKVPVKPVTEIWHFGVVGATRLVDEEPHPVPRRAAARVTSGKRPTRGR
jgi:hypothetical protein